MRVQIARSDSEELKSLYNYHVMGSTLEPPSALIESQVFPKRTDRDFYIYRRQYQERIHRITAAITRHVKAPATILDVGAAQGGHSLPLAGIGYHMVLNDLRKEAFEFVDMIKGEEQVFYCPGDFFSVNFA